MKTSLILASVAALTFITISERSCSKKTSQPSEQAVPAHAIEPAPVNHDNDNENCALPENTGTGSAQSMKFANKNFFIL